MLGISLLFAAQALAPTVPPQGAVMRGWVSVDGSVLGLETTMMVVRYKSQVVALGPYDPFGATRGMPSTAGPELGARATVSARDLWTGRWVLKGVSAQDMPYAAPINVTPAADVVVYPLDLDSKGCAGGRVAVQAMELSADCPARGESIWMLARIEDAEPALPLHEARVTRCDARTVEYTFVNERIDLRYSSGAPLLNAGGEVVGMALGGYREQREMVGQGVAAASLRAAIAGEAPPKRVIDLSGFDWERVHGEGQLLLNWGLTGQGEEELREALSVEPELLEVFSSISEMSWRNNMGNFEAISEEVLRWNAIYEEAGLPLVLSPVAAGQQLVILVHHELLRFTVQVGQEAAQVKLVERVEGSNVAAPTIARSTDLNAVLINAARVRSEAVLVWAQLGLNPSLDQEIQQALGEEDFQLLLAMAPARRKAESAKTSINARSSCSGFGVYEVPVSGPDDAFLGQLKRYVGTGSCAAIKASELKALAATQAPVPPAFERLAGHVLRGVVLQGVQEGPVGVTSALADPQSVWATRTRLCALSKQGHREAEAAEQAHGVCGQKDLKELPEGWSQVVLPELPERIATPRGEL